MVCSECREKKNPQMNILKFENKYQRHVLRYYNQYASMYDFGEFIRRGTRFEAFELSGWQDGDTVLDLCTGTGEVAIMFASKGAHVIGTDIARRMLQRASLKGRKGRTSWIEMDSTQLAFADDAFDISVLSLALHHMPYDIQLHVLRELRRVTRKKVVLIEPNTPVDPNWVPLWKFVATTIDESEHMHEWVHQDFPGTCREAGLVVRSVHEKTFRLHKIIICDPSADR
jgi:ubiquinone/menaquinone biosynthesis C-methylase UbiE